MIKSRVIKGVLGLATIALSAEAAKANVCDPSQYDRTVAVRTASELQNALTAARPGDLIQLSAGNYAGRFVASASASSARPIAVCGPKDAVIDAGGSGYGLHLKGSFYRLSGFTVKNGLKGIMLGGANDNILEKLEVSHVGQEAVHFRSHSSRNILRDSVIHTTGLKDPGYGEGIYVGSAKSNWGTWTAGLPDRSDNNQILRNHVYAIKAENIDVKEGTSGTLIEGNLFDGTGITGANYADSWVDVKGNDVIVRNNRGINSGSKLLDGYQTHVQLTGWGRNVTFIGNVSQVNGAGYAINIHSASTGVVVGCDNQFSGAAKGRSNIACSGSAPAPTPTPTPVPAPPAIPAPTPAPTPVATPVPRAPASTPVNLASESKVIRASALRTDHPLSNLFDACTSGTISCMIGSDKSEIFEVELDLGAVKTLTSVDLFGDASGSWVSQSMDIEIKSSSSDAYAALATNVPAKSASWIVVQAASKQARFVKVRIKGAAGTGAVQARELRVMGY